METSANTITTMGIIANEVYDDGNTIKYFKDNPENLIANKTVYEVIKHTDNSTLSGFNALLLRDTETNKYVIAFRGTESSTSDWITDILAGTFNINLQTTPQGLNLHF